MTNSITSSRKITVVIPYFNSSGTIKRCLASVINQSYSCLEILIINDASDDWPKAHHIIEKLNDDRIKVLHHKKNRNGSAARNTGILNSTGQFIAFLDADDEWLKDHLSLCLKQYSRLSRESLLFSKIKIISGVPPKCFETILPTKAIENGEKVSDYLFVDDQAIQTSSMFLNRDLAIRNLFDESLIRLQDLDYVLRLEQANVEFYLCNNIGTIVHWEEDYQSRNIKKGGTGSYFMKYCRNNKGYFSERAYTKFVIRKAFPNFIRERDFKSLLYIFLKECKWKYISFRDIIKIFAQILIRQNSKTWYLFKRMSVKFIFIAVILSIFCKFTL